MQSYSPKLYPCQINLHYQFYYNENYLHFHLHMNWGIHRPAMNKCCSQTTSRKGEWKGSVENFWLRQELKKCKYSSVCLSGEKWSRAHNIHLSLSGQAQVSLRSLPGLSVLTLSDRRSLKYFVLLFK